jgi:hypothetical protein
MKQRRENLTPNYKGKNKERPYMALDFTVKDVIHKVVAKFSHAFLPDATRL